MKKLLLVTTFLVAGFLAGIFAQRGLAPQTGERDGGTPAAAAAKTSPRDEAAAMHAGGKKGAGEKHDLASLLRWRQMQDIGHAEQLREIERMEDTELKGLLTDFAARMTEAGEDKPALYAVIGMAAKELYKREGEAALAWAGSQEDGRPMLLSALTSAAAYEDPVLALPWIERYQAEFGKDQFNTMVHEAVKGATSRGAEDLLKLKELYGDRLRGVQFPGGTFPEGFDFARFVSGMKGDFRLQSTVQYWAATDKDAAWSGVKDSIAGELDRLQFLGALFSGVAIMEGDKQAAEWLLPKLDEIPAYKRDQAIRALRNQASMTPASIHAIMPLLRDEGERMTLAKATITPFGGSGLPALRCLASDDSREEALLGAAGDLSHYLKRLPPAEKKRTTDNFTTMMNELKFSDERRQRVMGALLPEE